MSNERTYKIFSRGIWLYDSSKGGLVHRLSKEEALSYTPIETVIKNVIDNSSGKDLSDKLTIMFLELIYEYYPRE